MGSRGGQNHPSRDVVVPGGGGGGGTIPGGGGGGGGGGTPLEDAPSIIWCPAETASLVSSSE
jgi:hypothetical protein